MRRRTLQPDRLTSLLLSVFIAVVILAVAWANNRPISGPLGDPFTITLHAVSAGTEMHRIDAGAAHPFRIWRSEEATCSWRRRCRGAPSASWRRSASQRKAPPITASSR